MPFPLTFLAGRTCPPDLPNPVPDPDYLLFYRHYAIKGPQNPSTETILQTFDHVTEGTVAKPSLFTLCTKFLHFI
jgi:hypothetical protein